MACFAAGSSDLNNPSSSEKKKVTSPTSSPLGIGDTDQNGQLSTKKAGKRPRREADARHHMKRKMKLEHYEEMTNEVQTLRAECANSRQCQKLNDQKIEELIGIMKENRSSISSLNAIIQFQQQFIQFLFAQLNMLGHSQRMPTDGGGTISQQLNANSHFPGQNMHGYSQPIPTGGEGSVSYLIPQQHDVNSTFSGQFMNGTSQPMQTGDGESAYPFIGQEKAMEFSDLLLSTPPMETGGYPFIGQEKAMGFSDLLLSTPPMETGGGEVYLTSGN